MKFVKKITIVNGFRTSGISLALDGSEDKEFSYDINDNECDFNKYIGGQKEDKFNGYGRIISKNGEYYEGEWINGVIEGEGKYCNKEYIYTGKFKSNKLKEEIIDDNNED